MNRINGLDGLNEPGGIDAVSASQTASAASLLRFVTAGSVDDGKSTLIGRLLHDSRGLMADQLTAVQAASGRRGFVGVDFSLVTDGLLAEREQGITIDVAYRYFATPARKFVIGDCPGHLQYTRNMVTAASTADLAILLVDARTGVVEQTRRHAYLMHWLGVRELVLAVNKMDLIGWDRARFEAIRDDFESFATGLGFERMQVIPISALEGDNVVERGERAAWYTGPTLLAHLDAVPARSRDADGPLRLPVQRVLRLPRGAAQLGSGLEDSGIRAYQGTIEQGRLRVGDTLLLLPQRQQAIVRRLFGPRGPIDEGVAGEPVTVELDREIELSRGDMLVSPQAPAQVARRLDTELCWFDEEALDPTRDYLAKFGCKTVRARVSRMAYRIDVQQLREVPIEHPVTMNEVVRLELALHQPAAVDAYARSRATGALILIDETSNRTVAAGTIAAVSG